MRILITNIVLDGRTGTEIVTRDLARGYMARGHEVQVFTNRTGGISEEMMAAGVPVFTDPAALQRPEVIHANHCNHALAVFERFPGIPALVVCHDATAINAFSSLHPSIRRWSAVSEICRQRVADETALPVEKITLLPNYVDLEQANAPAEAFGAGKRWLYSAEKENSRPLRKRLRFLGRCFFRPVDQVALFSKPRRIVENFPALARHYDLVFASARCAIEAAATGAPVIVCDPRGLAGFLSPSTWHSWSPHNLGMGCLTRKLHPWSLAAEIRKANKEDAREVSRLIREERSLDAGLDRFEGIYRDMIAAA